MYMPTFTDIIQNYVMAIYSVVISAVFLVIIYGLLWILNRHTIMTPPKRRIFFIGGFAISFLVVWICLSVIARFDQQIEDIRNGSMQKGDLRAGILAALPLGKSEPSTNIIEGTMSSAGGNAAAAQSGINMLFIIRVVNLGAPTTAWNWKASIILKGGGTMDAQIPSIAHFGDASTPLPPLPTAYGPYTLKMDDNLLGALSSSPLVSGAAKQGWIVVHVNNLTEPPEGATFIITFEDVFGRQTKIEDVWKLGT